VVKFFGNDQTVNSTKQTTNPGGYKMTDIWYLFRRFLCYYQILKPEIPKIGAGDCHRCIPDNKNMNCPHFVPVSLMIDVDKMGEDMKLKRYIFESLGVNEAAYPHNIGFQELVEFYKVAKKIQKIQMEKLIKEEDWEGFKKLIRKTMGVKLK